MASNERRLKIYSDHMRIDGEALALECAMARRLREDPRLLELASKSLHEWRAREDPHSRRYLETWEKYVTQRSLDELIEFMTDLSDHGDAFRQADPFHPTEILQKTEIERIARRVNELFDEMLATPQPEECRRFSSRYIYQDQFDTLRQKIKEEFLETVGV